MKFTGLRHDLRKKFQYFQEWKQASSWVSNWFPIFLASNSYLNNKWKQFTGRYLYKHITVKVSYAGQQHLFCVPYDMINEGPSFLLNGKRYIDRFSQYFSGFNVDNGLLVDIGAHVGSFSIPIVLSHRNMKIIAAEPFPDNIDVYRKNIELNDLNKQVQLYPGAIYDKETTLEFGSGKRSTVGSIIEVESYKFFHGKKSSFGTGKRLTIPTTTLEKLLKDNSETCTMLKMDCEGSEYRIFESSSELISKFKYLMIEAHPSSTGDPLQLKERIAGMGYTIHSDNLGNGCYEFFCEKN